MNKFLLYPLLIMALIAFMNQAYNFSNTDVNFDSQVIIGSQSGTIGENGSSTQIETGIAEQNLTLGIDTNYFILFIGIIIAIGVALGITALGSGLSGQSQKIAFNAAIWLPLWILISVLVATLIISIPIFGTLMYISLTAIYFLGFVRTINGDAP
jgi:hypothetical protein